MTPQIQTSRGSHAWGHRLAKGWTRLASIGLVAPVLLVLSCSSLQPCPPGGESVDPTTLRPGSPVRLTLAPPGRCVPPERLHLRVEATSDLWLLLDCQDSGDAVIATLRGDTGSVVHGTENVWNGVPVFEYVGLGAGHLYDLALENTGTIPLTCWATAYLFPITFRASFGKVDVIEESLRLEDRLFPVGGLSTRHYRIDLASRRVLHVSARATSLSRTGPPPVASSSSDGDDVHQDARALHVALLNLQGETLLSATETLDAYALLPERYDIEVTGSQAVPTTTYELSVSIEDACLPVPIHLVPGKWKAVRLEASPSGCDVAVATVSVHTRTRLVLEVQSERMEDIVLSYQAPGKRWRRIDPIFRVDPVTAFGNHRVRVAMRGPVKGGTGVTIRLRATVPVRMVVETGRVIDVRSDGTVLVDLSSWQGLKPGMKANLIADGKVVGRLVLVSAAPRACLFRVVRSTEVPRLDMRVDITYE